MAHLGEEYKNASVRNISSPRIPALDPRALGVADEYIQVEVPEIAVSTTVGNATIRHVEEYCRYAKLASSSELLDFSDGN